MYFYIILFLEQSKSYILALCSVNKLEFNFT